MYTEKRNELINGNTLSFLTYSITRQCHLLQYSVASLKPVSVRIITREVTVLNIYDAHEHARSEVESSRNTLANDSSLL
jgi:hypothetical protein